MTKKGFRTALVRFLLAGSVFFSNLPKPAFAGEFSPKKDEVSVLEDDRTIKLGPDSEYNIEKEFLTEDGIKIRSKVGVDSKGVSRGFIVEHPSGDNWRITYDIKRDLGKDSAHMNILKNEKIILKNQEREINIIAGSREEAVLKKIISENEYIPKTPSRFLGKSYNLNVFPRRNSKIFYTAPGTTKEVLMEGSKSFLINPSRKVKNLIRVGSSNVKLEELVGTSLSDGPEFGPIDALLTLWLLYDGASIAQEILKNYDLNETFKGLVKDLFEDNSHFDHREINKTLKLRYPERFENEPLDIDPRTGHTIVKNPVNYYSNFPEPYRTYMYNVMKMNPGRWGTSKETLEKAFGGQDYPGKNLGYQLSEEQKKDIQKIGNSSQPQVQQTRQPPQNLEKRVEEPQVSYKKNETKQEPSSENEEKYSEENVRLAEKVKNLMSEASELTLKKEYGRAISNYEQLLNLNCEIAGFSKYEICRQTAGIFSFHQCQDNGISYDLLDQIEKWNRKALEYASSEDKKSWVYGRLADVCLYRGDKQELMNLYDEWIAAVPSNKTSLTERKNKELKNWEWSLEHYHSKVK